MTGQIKVFYTNNASFTFNAIILGDIVVRHNCDGGQSWESVSGAPVEVKEPEVPLGDCAVCNNIAKAICTGCKNVFYCTRGCQKKHWASHKEDCKSLVKLPYRVSQNIMKEERIPFFRKMFLYSHV